MLKSEKTKKEKLIGIIGASVFGIVIAAIVIWITFFEKGDKIIEADVNFGDAIVIQNNDLSLSVVSQKNEILFESDIKGDRIIPNNNASAIYIIKSEDKTNSVHKLFYNKGEIALKKMYDFELENLKESDIKWHGDTGAFFDESAHVFKVINPEFLKTQKVKVEGMIESWTLTDEALYYSIDNIIYRYDLKTEKVTSELSIEDKTLSLFVKEDVLYVASQFGSSKNTSTLLMLDQVTLDIIDLTTISSTDIKIFSSLTQDEHLYYKLLNQTKNNEVFYSYDAIEKRMGSELASALSSVENIWFGNKFAYTSTKGTGAVYSIYSSTPIFQTEQTVVQIYPLYK